MHFAAKIGFERNLTDAALPRKPVVETPLKTTVWTHQADAAYDLCYYDVASGVRILQKLRAALKAAQL